MWTSWLKATSEKGPHLSCVVFTISRGVVGIGHGMQQVSQSKKQISRAFGKFSEDDFVLGKDLFWGAKEERGNTGEVDVCCSPQPPEALEDPDV